MQEIEDPELATARTRALCRANGYSEAWIEKRMRGIAVRAELTEEWGKNRDVKGEPEYAILTAEIPKAAFGLTLSEYKDLKGLELREAVVAKNATTASDGKTYQADY